MLVPHNNASSEESKSSSGGTSLHTVAPSTMIPSIGQTFSAAAQKIATMVEEDRQDPTADLYDDFAPLDAAMMEATPRTPADVLAVLDRMLCPGIGLVGEVHRFAQPLQKVRDALGALFGAGPAPSTSTIVPTLGLTFRDAVDRCLDLIAQQDAVSIDTEEGEARADALADQWLPMLDKILTTAPITPADGVAITDLLLDAAAGLPINNVRDEKLGAIANLRDLLKLQATPPADAAALLDTFRRWVENESRFNSLPEDSDEADDVETRCKKLCMEIASLPARTAAGLCVKLYVHTHWQNGSPANYPAAAIDLPVLLPGCVGDALFHSMFKDALALMPELNALMGGVE